MPSGMDETFKTLNSSVGEDITRLILERHGANQTHLVASLSREPSDPCWDEFVASHPLGHYQQSSSWAMAKKLQGWERIRVLLSRDNFVVSGFQILTKPSRFGRVGYLSKGPVCEDNNDAVLAATLRLLTACVAKFKIRALICQPPDVSLALTEMLTKRGFRPFLPYLVNEATLIADLQGGINSLESRMNATARNVVRQAKRKGITIREGNRGDLGTFFQLMLHTCARQGVLPNPPSIRELTHYWDVLHQTGLARLSFAEFAGVPIAGAFCIPFGHRCTFRKKGWNGLHRDKYPNDAVVYEAMAWAQHQGLKWFDFGDVDRTLAEAILDGKELTEDQRRSPHLFHLRFGGRPMRLPRATIYLANPVFRCAYELAIRAPFLRKRLASLAAGTG